MCIRDSLYSTKMIGLSKRDLLRFMRHYNGNDLRAAITIQSRFWNEVKQRADNIFEKLGPAT